MRVLIAEDLVLLQDGLRRLLTASGLEVVETVADGGVLLERLLAVRPDVAVVDVRLPPTFSDEGLRAAVAARREVPGLPVLVLSQYVEPLYASELLADGAGGVGYLLKDRVVAVAEFVEAVRRVAAGGVALDPDVVSQLLAPGPRRRRLSALTGREMQVLELLAEGRSNRAIAAALGVGEKVVAKHIGHVLAKLELESSDDDNRRVLAVLAFLGEPRTG